MPIEATSPSVLNQTYDKWAFEFHTYEDGCVDYAEPGPSVPIRAHALMVKARIREDGTWERSPLPSDRVTVIVDDLGAAIASDPSGPMATAYGALVAAVQSFAESQGKL